MLACVMDEIKRISANLPAKLLDEAVQTTGEGITDTLIYGLKLVKRTRAYQKAQALRGKLDLAINIDISRERTSS